MFFFTPPHFLFFPTSFLNQCCCLFCTDFFLYIALCPAASESVLLQHLFQSKLTQTGSLVPAAQGRIGLRGTKVALMLQRMPSTSSVNATCIPQQPRRYHDLTKVMLFIVFSSRLQYFIPTSTHTKEILQILWRQVSVKNVLTEAVFHIKQAAAFFIQQATDNQWKKQGQYFW